MEGFKRLPSTDTQMLQPRASSFGGGVFICRTQQSESVVGNESSLTCRSSLPACPSSPATTATDPQARSG